MIGWLSPPDVSTNENPCKRASRYFPSYFHHPPTEGNNHPEQKKAHSSQKKRFVPHRKKYLK